MADLNPLIPQRQMLLFAPDVHEKAASCCHQPGCPSGGPKLEPAVFKGH